MEELRSEIRAAFGREQADYPPAPGLRRDVVDAVTTRRRPASDLRWVAVAAAVILGFLVVAGLMSTRLMHPPAPAGKPAPSLPVLGTPVDGKTMVPLTIGYGDRTFEAFNATGESLFLAFACRSTAPSSLTATLTRPQSGEVVASQSDPCVGPGSVLDEMVGFKGQMVLTIHAPADTRWEVYVLSGPTTGQ